LQGCERCATNAVGVGAVQAKEIFNHSVKLFLAASAPGFRSCFVCPYG
jgi:hypothetical protein